ncbi:MAG: hypothetical protein K2L55_01620 [Muribaculaceae bacterium]|nr:hypothetical protein [Muribaculaceae bacterium]
MSGKFEIQFRKLYLPLGMYALRLVDDAVIAEDMVQDAFMKAWIYIEKGGEIDNFTAFMYRTLRNVCLSYLRDKRDMLGPEHHDKSSRRSGSRGVPKHRGTDRHEFRIFIRTAQRHARIGRCQKQTAQPYAFGHVQGYGHRV